MMASFWYHPLSSLVYPFWSAHSIFPLVYWGRRLFKFTEGIKYPNKRLFAMIVVLVVRSVNVFTVISCVPFWYPQQSIIAISLGNCTTSWNYKIYLPYIIGLFLAFKYPLSFQLATWTCSIKNAYLDSVYIFSLFPVSDSKALVRGINSTSCADVPDSKAWVSIIFCKDAMAYPV